MDNPFEEILTKLQKRAWIKNRTENPKELLIFCLTQIKLLYTLYRSMLEFDIQGLSKKIQETKEINHFDYLTLEYKHTKSILDYFGFINILNQFGRVLFIKYKISIPSYNRIKFFRNKVLEHWDDYTLYSRTTSISQKKGKPAIPSIYQIYTKLEDRQAQIDIINAILKNYDATLEIDDPMIVNVIDSPGVSEKIYKALEQIDPQLTSKNDKGVFIIPDELIKTFFKFGFPIPVQDVENYSNNLVEFLYINLKLS